MAADNTSGHDIFIAFKAEADCIFFHPVKGNLGKSFGIHQIQTFSGNIMFRKIFFHIGIHKFFNRAAVFLGGKKLSVHDLDQWFQTEQCSAQVCSIGDPSAGFQIVQISRNEGTEDFLVPGFNFISQCFIVSDSIFFRLNDLICFCKMCSTPPDTFLVSIR